MGSQEEDEEFREVLGRASRRDAGKPKTSRIDAEEMFGPAPPEEVCREQVTPDVQNDETRRQNATREAGVGSRA